MENICIYPKIKKDNIYIQNFINTLDDFNVIEFSKIIKNPFLFFSIDIFHFNWYENFKTKKAIAQYFEFRFKVFLLLMIKICKKKIIWTMHNKKTHSNKNKYSDRLVEILLEKSDRVLIHCSESLKYIDNLSKKEIEEKVVLIPHGNYIGCYQSKGINIREKYNLGENEIVYMFIGKISRYKNIDLLIEGFLASEARENKLLIIGDGDKTYINELLNTYRFDNIIFDFHFVPDDEMVDYISCADIFICPYDLESSLNSGSLIMYFSYGKTAISPYIGTLKDIPENFFYSYTYINSSQHKKNLTECINQAHNQLSNDRNLFSKKGKEAYNFVNQNYDWNKLKIQINNLYKYI